MGERRVRNAEVEGSIPFDSTRKYLHNNDLPQAIRVDGKPTQAANGSVNRQAGRRERKGKKRSLLVSWSDTWSVRTGCLASKLASGNVGVEMPDQFVQASHRLRDGDGSLRNTDFTGMGEPLTVEAVSCQAMDVLSSPGSVGLSAPGVLH